MKPLALKPPRVRKSAGPGAPAIEGMDAAIADHPDGRGAQGTEHDGQWHGYGRHQTLDRLAGQHHVGGEEAHVDQRRDADDQQGAIAAELAATLHHLGNAQTRALGRGQGQHHPAEQMPEHDGHQAPDQIQVEGLDHHGAGDDGQRRDIGTEPEGEEIAAMAVAFGRGDVIHGMGFDGDGGARGCGHPGIPLL